MRERRRLPAIFAQVFCALAFAAHETCNSMPHGVDNEGGKFAAVKRPTGPPGKPGRTKKSVSWAGAGSMPTSFALVLFGMTVSLDQPIASA